MSESANDVEQQIYASRAGGVSTRPNVLNGLSMQVSEAVLIVSREAEADLHAARNFESLSAVRSGAADGGRQTEDLHRRCDVAASFWAAERATAKRASS
ncbi:MAG: hypothetical protein QM638_11555 [Nocardioides sp.]|uniref:hypothetical protein n=1 Tax=Nocardioides sp. TaxID=35761 RepID=UPI0039E292C4